MSCGKFIILVIHIDSKLQTRERLSSVNRILSNAVFGTATKSVLCRSIERKHNVYRSPLKFRKFLTRAPPQTLIR